MIKKTLANYELNEKLSIMYAHPGHFTKRSFKTRSAYGKYRDSSVNFWEICMKYIGKSDI